MLHFPPAQWRERLNSFRAEPKVTNQWKLRRETKSAWKPTKKYSHYLSIYYSPSLSFSPCFPLMFFHLTIPSCTVCCRNQVPLTPQNRSCSWPLTFFLFLLSIRLLWRSFWVHSVRSESPQDVSEILCGSSQPAPWGSAMHGDFRSLNERSFWVLRG